MADHEHSEDAHGSSHGGGGGGHGGHGGGGHGGGGAHEEHEGAPEWLISFADNVALMMGFFVVLLAMNMAKPKTGGIGGEAAMGGGESRMLDFILGVREAFNSPIDYDSSDPNEQTLAKHMTKREKVGDTRSPGPAGENKDNQSIGNQPYFANCGLIPFEPDSDTLTQDALTVISEVARAIRGTQFIVEIRGHVSSNEAFSSTDQGMDLSYHRALAVQRALVGAGVERRILRVLACGDNERATARPDTSEGHKTNQRVEVMQTQWPAPHDPYAKER